MAVKSRLVKILGLLYLTVLLTFGLARPASAQGCWVECLWAIQMCGDHCAGGWCDFGCSTCGSGCCGYWSCR